MPRHYIQYIPRNMHTVVVLCFVVVMQSFIMNSHEVFIHIHQGCFAGTGAIVRLPQCQWSKPDGYGKISQCITTTMHSKAKTVCIFLGIYCNSLRMSDVYMHQGTYHHWFRWWLVTWLAPSHYLNQWWNIVNWSPGKKLQWNRYLNLYIFIQEMSSGKWRPFCLSLIVITNEDSDNHHWASMS